MLIFYTTEEGGLWRPLETEQEEDVIVSGLRMQWSPMRPFPSSRLIVGNEVIKIHAVLFPDSSVWDSHYGKLMQHPRAGYYEEVNQLVGGADATEQTEGKEEDSR